MKGKKSDSENSKSDIRKLKDGNKAVEKHVSAMAKAKKAKPKMKTK